VAGARAADFVPHVALAANPALQPVDALPAAATLPVSVDAAIRRYARIIDAASLRYGVDGALVRAMILVESSYDPEAVSAAGACGLMQLMPETAKHYAVADVFNPEDNIRGGVRYLKDLLAQFDGDVELALAAYNAGATAVIRAGKRIPAHPETAAFVPKVIAHYRRFQTART
jgi:soluble lytic murein transglycosylase-like protein